MAGEFGEQERPKSSSSSAASGPEGQKAPQTLAEWAQYGVGDIIDTVDGVPIYEDYKVPKHLRPAAPDKNPTPTWAWLMEHWPHIQADLMQIYGVRDDRAEEYQGPWFVNLVHGLLSEPTSRISRLWEYQNQ